MSTFTGATCVMFDVLGVPAPQGSKRAVPTKAGVRLIEQSSRLGDWRSTIAAVAFAERAKLGRTLDGPLYLHARFRFPMPKSRPKAARERGEIYKTTAPDLDKLVRALGDALTQSGLIADDARLCVIDAAKVETTEWTGAHVYLQEQGHAL